MASQGRLVIGRIADAEFALHRARQSAVGKIAACLGPARRLQFGLEEGGRHFHDVIKRGALLLARFILGSGNRHRQSGVGRQALDCFRKAQSVLFDKKSEDVA